MMKDSKIDPRWVQEQMRANPPSLRPNGDIFSGPVRLSFPNLEKPGKPGDDGGDGKYGASLLFPPGTDMGLFSKLWFEKAREAFPKNFDQNGNPVGLHSPFHDQGDKAFSAKPLAGYTPGAIYMAATSKFKPTVVDGSMNLIVDYARVYPGVWAFVTLNAYSYKNKKTGVAFGLQQVMIIADDTKLAGGGGDPKQAFGDIKITAASNIAARFDQVPGASTGPAPASIMPGSGAGHPGSLPIQPLESDDAALMASLQ
jgi:ssDNA-binding protein